MNVYTKSFAAGEICPALYGRVDLVKYATGLRTLRNMFVARHGGAYNRAGTMWRSSAFDQTRRIRLHRFNTQAGSRFILEFGHLYVRILIDGRAIRLADKTIVSVTKGITTQIGTSVPHGFKVNELVTLSGVTGIPQLNGARARIASIPSSSLFVLNIDSSAYTGIGSNAGTAAAVPSEADRTRIPVGVTSIVKGTTTTITTLAPHQLNVGDAFALSGITGATALNGELLTVQSVTSPTVVVAGFNSSAVAGTPVGGTLTPTVARSITFTTPFTEAMLRELTFAQESHTLIITHQKHLVFPQTLTFSGPESWTFADTSTAPSVAAPASLSLSIPTGTSTYWGVTAVQNDTFEESFVTVVGGNAAATSTAPVTLNWPAVSNATQYNIYSGANAQTLGFRTVVYTNSFVDNGTLFVDFTQPPPAQRDIFQKDPGTGAFAHPACVGYYQQRRFYGNIGPVSDIPPAIGPTVPTNADRIYASRIGSTSYFALMRPTGDDDAISFRMLAREPQIIRHFLDIGKLAVFTEQGEWILAGGADGGLTPSAINPTNVSQNGIGFLRPLPLNNVGLYVQRSGKVVRTFGYEFQIEGYRGDDLTIFASHLTRYNSIVAWDFVRTPHPIVWCAKDDGTVIGLTFVPEQAIFAWHRHDFVNGFVEDVLQSDDRIYFVIRRVINGQTVRYIERLSNRDYTDIKEARFMDAHTSYDGRKTDGSTVTLSGGTMWDVDDVVTLTASTASFSTMTAAVHVTGADGTFIRVTNLTYMSPTVMTGTLERLVPPSMRNVGIAAWVDARTIITGLMHLEGQKVSVIGDGFVVASPNNPDYDVITVTNGQIDLGGTAYGRVHVGLPITSDLETLNIDTAQGETILDRKKLTTKVSAWVEDTRGVWAGAQPPDDDSQDALEGLDTSLAGMSELKARYDEGYDSPTKMITRVIEINVQAQWNMHGRVFLRQVDPLPMGILSVAAGGFIPFGGG